jgi:DNA invertase Pin-like site-specific DNA recombinase
MDLGKSVVIKGELSGSEDFTLYGQMEGSISLPDHFEYVHGRSLTPKTWIDKAMSAVQAAADEAHREQTRERVHESLSAKAQRGLVTGGRCFGYRNRDVYNGVDQHGRPLRSHVDYEFNPDEAAVVRRIFSLFGDENLGLRRIAITLNQDGAARPKPFVRKDGYQSTGWSASTVRAVLKRRLYAGVKTWNESRKRDDWG